MSNWHELIQKFSRVQFEFFETLKSCKLEYMSMLRRPILNQQSFKLSIRTILNFKRPSRNAVLNFENFMARKFEFWNLQINYFWRINQLGDFNLRGRKRPVFKKRRFFNFMVMGLQLQTIFYILSNFLLVSMYTYIFIS